jgi:Na+/proline symporter
MNKRRIIFFGIFGFYNLVAFIFTLYLDSQKNDFGILTKMLANISLFKWLTLIGLVLIIVDFIWWFMESKAAKKEQEAARLENNTLKAKVYDFQESSKSTPKPATNTPS